MGITRAYIHHLAAKETAGAHLLTMHNVYYLLDMMTRARTAILEDKYPQFMRKTFKGWYGKKEDFPEWAVTACRGVGLELCADD